MFLGPFDDQLFDSVERLKVRASRFLTPQIAAVQHRGIPVVGDIELFARVATAPVVAITGSKWQSTYDHVVGRDGQGERGQGRRRWQPGTWRSICSTRYRNSMF